MTARWPYFSAGGLMLLVAFVVAIRSEHPPPAIRPVSTIEGVDAWACPGGTVGRVSCAFVDVPEDYDDPDIRDVQLFAARITPPIETDATPIVFIGDELGSTAVSDFGEWQGVARTLGRTVYLLDMRGSGGSLPRLSCPGVQTSQWSQADLTEASIGDDLGEIDGLLAECRDRLASSVTLDAFDLDAMAADLETVASKFHVDQWIVVGGGDTSFVARRAAALHDHVEAIVALGAAPRLSGLAVDRVRYADEVLDIGLSTESIAALGDAIEPLGERSIVFPVQTNGRTRRVAVNDAVAFPVVARQLADPEFRAAADTYVQRRLDGGQWRSLAVLRDRQQRAIATNSLPVRLSVLCGDTGPDDPPWWSESGEATHRWVGLLDDPTLDPGLCDSWVDVAEVADLDGDVPILAINGELDVTAPRSAADELVESTSAVAVVVPDVGRPSPFSDCSIIAITQFLDGDKPTLEACA